MGMKECRIGMVSLGCSKNQVDAEIMLGEISAAGYKVVNDPEEADIIIVNTCGFIESAQQESVDTILEMAQYKESGRCRGLIVTGCMAQVFQQQLRQELPEVDAVLGTGSYEKILEAIGQVEQEHSYESFENIHCGVLHGTHRMLTTPPYTAYLKIAEGCDNRCAYCAIPSIRGDFRSRPMEDIVEEAKELAASGVKECIVIAQDITRYGQDLYGEYRLDELLTRLCQLDFTWIRLHYCYPDKMTDKLIEVIAREDKIVKYLDLPVQHSSSAILSAMNRRGDGPYLRKLFARLRKQIPGVAIRTSLIVGFPGETEEDFEDLCRFVQEVRFERLGVFPYSRMEGTPAYDMPGQIEEEVKLQRQEIIMDLQEGISQQDNQQMVGKILTVLVEYEEDGWLVGRSYRDSVEIDPKVRFRGGAHVPGDFVPVQITDCDAYDLLGEEVVK
ncbi:MAG: 30S ribosomal protein S12 methylthiotransferase RimO [Eubacteriales bacterium]|jgi:ribosomal protein S12 methylthiotransferase